MEKEDYQENWDEGIGKECLFFFLQSDLFLFFLLWKNLTQI